MSTTQPQGEEESTNPNKKKKAPEPKAPEPKAPEPKAPEPKAPVVSQQEEEEVCPVCIEPLQKISNKFTRNICCGKGMHFWCHEGIKVSSLSQKQKNCCPLCRTVYPKSVEEEIEQLHLWVEKGKAWAQCMLGQKYRDGVGVEKSAQRARELLESAASQRYATAQFTLGVMYEDGQGVDQSYEIAAAYYEAAAKQGHADAQFNLGLLYYKGQGVEQSNEKARELWMKSAEQGNESAIKGLQILDKAEGRTTPSFILNPIECASCYRPHDPPEHRLKPCNRCHRVYYCGKECQVKHWEKKINGHKGLCTPESEKAREARGAQEAKKGGGGEEPKTTTATTDTHVTFRF
jgi:hypothetical protein